MKIFSILGWLSICGVLMTASVQADSEAPAGSRGIDLEEVERDLAGDGVVGFIHGAVAETRMFVFTYRDPNNFFVYIDFPMIPGTREVDGVVATLDRHDKVSIKGRFVDNEAPLKHILVTSIEVVERWEGPRGEYEYETLPEELEGRTELIGKVHGVGNQGRVLVIEYGDLVLPVFVSAPEWTNSLYRNDKIRLSYHIRMHPNRPPHLELNAEAAEPVVVLDRMVDWHGDEIVMEGALVLFPQSPQIIFDVYALEQVDELGIKRDFTLVNFEDQEEFARIREKLAAAWEAQEASAQAGRNNFVNRQISLRVTGTINVTSPAQANPQILLDSADDIEITFLSQD